MSNWQLQDAKACLAEVVTKAAEEGPQHITLRGERIAVILSETDYERLTNRPKRFINFIRSSPLNGVELDLARD